MNKKQGQLTAEYLLKLKVSSQLPFLKKKFDFISKTARLRTHLDCFPSRYCYFILLHGIVVSQHLHQRAGRERHIPLALPRNETEA